MSVASSVYGNTSSERLHPNNHQTPSHPSDATARAAGRFQHAAKRIDKQYPDIAAFFNHATDLNKKNKKKNAGMQKKYQKMLSRRSGGLEFEEWQHEIFGSSRVKHLSMNLSTGATDCRASTLAEYRREKDIKEPEVLKIRHGIKYLTAERHFGASGISAILAFVAQEIWMMTLGEIPSFVKRLSGRVQNLARSLTPLLDGYQKDNGHKRHELPGLLGCVATAPPDYIPGTSNTANPASASRDESGFTQQCGLSSSQLTQGPDVSTWRGQTAGSLDEWSYIQHDPQSREKGPDTSISNMGGHTSGFLDKWGYIRHGPQPCDNPNTLMPSCFPDEWSYIQHDPQPYDNPNTLMPMCFPVEWSYIQHDPQPREKGPDTSILNMEGHTSGFLDKWGYVQHDPQPGPNTLMRSYFSDEWGYIQHDPQLGKGPDISISNMEECTSGFLDKWGSCFPDEWGYIQHDPQLCEKGPISGS